MLINVNTNPNPNQKPKCLWTQKLVLENEKKGNHFADFLKNIISIF